MVSGQGHGAANAVMQTYDIPMVKVDSLHFSLELNWLTSQSNRLKGEYRYRDSCAGYDIIHLYTYLCIKF